LSTKSINIFIIAIRNNVAFNDDLIKIIAGVPLLKYSIETAQNINGDCIITLITDCDSVQLFARRNGVNTIFEKNAFKNQITINDSLFKITTKINNNSPIIFISPYSPMIEAYDYEKALKQFNDAKSDFLFPVQYKYSKLISNNSDIYDFQKVFNRSLNKHLVQINGFIITNKEGLIKQRNKEKIKISQYLIDSQLVEINSYKDWWICEKLILRRRIVFRVIGNNNVGTGHIYRALTLAHEIVDHEIIFVTEHNNDLVINKLAEYNYKLEVFNSHEIEKGIIKIRPHLVINDFLNTDKEYINLLKSHGIKTINFEDLGDGASKSNKTINELYDEPIINSKNILWGHKYSFLRDEFSGATINKFEDKVSKLLITFGGTDPSNYTQKTLDLIYGYCLNKNITIFIVTGAGYKYINKLENIMGKYSNVKFSHSLGIMSEVMENCQCAISSNGRTIYELAHMHIPSIILSHHDREDTHNYGIKGNGFIPIGIFNNEDKEKLLMQSLSELVENSTYRKQLFNSMQKADFMDNKKRVVKILDNVLND
jgi:spore coat polysaccharide biosynthesis predicted glycosyltransferase SpsG/CMP-N-acetylneuraminic acid synthetase